MGLYAKLYGMANRTSPSTSQLSPIPQAVVWLLASFCCISQPVVYIVFLVPLALGSQAVLIAIEFLDVYETDFWFGILNTLRNSSFNSSFNHFCILLHIAIHHSCRSWNRFWQWEFMFHIATHRSHPSPRSPRSWNRVWLWGFLLHVAICRSSRSPRFPRFRPLGSCCLCNTPSWNIETCDR